MLLQLPNATNRRCPVCGIEKPLTVDNFQIVPSFQKGFSYYCNNCDPESRKQKTITPEEFNLFLNMKRRRRWESKFVILSWFYLLFILSNRYGLIPQAAGSPGVVRWGCMKPPFLTDQLFSPQWIWVKDPDLNVTTSKFALEFRSVSFVSVSTAPPSKPLLRNGLAFTSCNRRLCGSNT